MKKSKALLIIGGMGPQASGYLYKLLVDMAIKEFGAKNNDDFPEIILYSIPVPDFISDDRNRSKALYLIKQRIKIISDSNISCISLACNTAHVLLPELQANSKIPFVSMIDETAKQVYANRIKKVGFIGTPSTIKNGLYQTELNKYKISTIIPSGKQIKILESVIRSVLKGRILAKHSKVLKKIADGLKAQGAEAIILGCTELPLVFPKKYSLPVYNSVEVLASALLRRYYEQNTIQGYYEKKNSHRG